MYCKRDIYFYICSMNDAATTKILVVYGDRLLIKEDEKRVEETKSGIIIPGTVDFKESTGLQKHLITGEVLTIGDDCRYAKTDDHILFGRGDVARIEFQNSNYSIIRESAILLKMNGDDILSVNNDRVLVKPEARKEKTEGGLFIPANANYEPTAGEAFRVGSDCRFIKEGQRIMFGKNAGMEISIKGTSYIIIREADVVGNID
jgi:chaperonin GroES